MTAHGAPTGGLVTWAAQIVDGLLAEELPRRHAHCVGVGARSRRLGEAFLDDEADCDLLTTAGTVHDIGYAPTLVDAGHHAVDGARYLRQIGADDRLVSLVGWHSTAEWEVPLCGTVIDYPEPTDRRLRDLLWLADFTTSPDGTPVSPQRRCGDIRGRYRADSTPVRAMDAAMPAFTAILGRYRIGWDDTPSQQHLERTPFMMKGHDR